MLNDINLSDEFKLQIANEINDKIKFDFNVNILTSGCWPV